MTIIDDINTEIKVGSHWGRFSDQINQTTYPFQSQVDGSFKVPFRYRNEEDGKISFKEFTVTEAVYEYAVYTKAIKRFADWAHAHHHEAAELTRQLEQAEEELLRRATPTV